MKTIELLLLENVPNLGIVGDVVKVKPGYARNYLLPHGLAIPPTQGMIEKLAERRAQVEAELKALRSKQEAMIEKLSDFELTIERSCNDQGVLYGGVTQHEVAELLREQGYEVEDRFVRLGDQIKRVDTYEVPVVIDKELKTEIKLWVVSDRPLDLDEDEAADGEDSDAEASAPEESASTPEAEPASAAE